LPKTAIVCGRRRERSAEASVYNRLCDLEWETPVGEVLACGGDSLVRVSALRQVGGFDVSVLAGEEPELCARLQGAGWKVRRLDVEMTRHDAAMTHLGQFWRRQVRTGWGALDVSWRFPHARGSFLRTCVSTWLWTVGWLLLANVVGVLLNPWATLTVLVLWPLQIGRLAWQGRRRGLGTSTALAWGAMTMVGKWAQLQGHGRYIMDRCLGRGLRLIEYKGAVDPDWQADRARYPRRAFLREQSVWAVAVYRFGRRVDRLPAGVRKKLLDRIYWFLFRAVETLTGISLPRAARIGPGLRIWHFGNIFIHPRAILGARCTLRQGVTIGDRHLDGPVPVLEDDVEVGAYAQILGGVHIGRGARIGAMSVVLHDVPAGATAVGIPAQVLPAPPRPERNFEAGVRGGVV
jgi:serine O-acetyltransferase